MEQSERIQMHIRTILQSSYYWLANCVWTEVFTLVPMVLHWKTNPLGPTLIELL